jgi:hypothetical protein
MGGRRRWARIRSSSMGTQAVNHDRHAHNQENSGGDVAWRPRLTQWVRHYQSAGEKSSGGRVQRAQSGFPEIDSHGQQETEGADSNQ